MRPLLFVCYAKAATYWLDLPQAILYLQMVGPIQYANLLWHAVSFLTRLTLEVDTPEKHFNPSLIFVGKEEVDQSGTYSGSGTTTRIV